MREVVDTIIDLRTIHGDFSEREISDEQIRTILDCAVRAANALPIACMRSELHERCGWICTAPARARTSFPLWYGSTAVRGVRETKARKSDIWRPLCGPV